MRGPWPARTPPSLSEILRRTLCDVTEMMRSETNTRRSREYGERNVRRSVSEKERGVMKCIWFSEVAGGGWVVTQGGGKRGNPTTTVKKKAWK